LSNFYGQKEATMNKQSFNFKVATERLRGSYDKFAVAFAPQLSEVIYAPKGRKVTCPVYGQPKKFNVHPDQDEPHGVFNLLMWATGASAKEVLAFAKTYLGEDTKPLSQAEVARRERAAKAKEERKRRKNRERLVSLYKSSTKGYSPEVEAYLKVSRGIHNLIPPADISFSAQTPYRDDNGNLGTAPAILGMMRNPQGKAVTLHRIFLDKTFNKSVLGKLMMPPSGEVMGGAIRLYPVVTDVLGIAEGIETACAATSFFGIPTWAAVSASMLAGFQLPPELEGVVKTVIIWADKDKTKTGETVANQLKENLEGKGLKVIIMLPPQSIPEDKKGIDWLDVCYPAR